MPRPRFEKLKPEKRQRILDAAAEEFADNGFENASFNRILENAEISKGAAYYYFDDKADLFTTVVLAYWQALAEELVFDLDALTIDNFWEATAQAYRRQFAAYRGQPLMARVLRAAASYPVEDMQTSPLAGPMIEMMALLESLYRRGQELDAVRDDLPMPLMLELIMSVDEVGDNWLLSRWESITDEELEAHIALVVDIVRRMLQPA